MDDPSFVRRFEGFRDLLRDRQRVGERHGAASDPLREFLALDQFHDDECRSAPVRPVPRVLPLQPIDVRDVRMVQRREQFGFPLESHEAIGVAGHRGGQHFDRDLTLQAGVGGAVNLSHAADPEGGHDRVRAEASAGGQRHVGRILRREGAV